jgi:hypothetical protein
MTVLLAIPPWVALIMFFRIVELRAVRPLIHAYVRCLLISLSGILSVTATPGRASMEVTHPPYSYTPSALPVSVGTSIDMANATRVLLSNFTQLANGGAPHDAPAPVVTIADLTRVADERDGTFSGELRVAARFFLSSPVDRFFVSLNSGREKPDGSMTRAGLESTLRTLSAGQYEPALLDMIDRYEKRSGIRSTVFYEALLRDPGVPVDVRNRIIHRFSDEQLLQIIGRPNVQGDTRDQAEETSVFMALARVSWLGAAEAEVLVRYKIPFRMDRGPSDKNISFWNGQDIHLSEKMANGGAPGYLSEVLAHEGGHAIFQKSGLQDKTYRDADAARLTPRMGNIINEGFAGVFGMRAHIALFGHNDRAADRHLVLLNDVGDSIVNDSTFYAKYYHVDTAAARAQIEAIKHVIGVDLVPFLERNFNLPGDPQLSLGLAPINR